MPKDSNNSASQPSLAASRASILDRTPPPEIFRRHLELRRLPSVILLCMLSVVLLWISFSPFNCWIVAYFALVPWAMAMAGGTKRRQTICLGWLGGVVFWAICLHWLALPTIAGYIAAVVYLSLYWLVASLLVSAAMHRNWPMWLTLPIFWVAMEYAQAHILGGFSWFYLSQTQYAQTSLIQISDLTGQYGVTFFVAMVNGTIIDLLGLPLFVLSRRGGGRLSRQVFWGLAASLVVGLGLWGYGQWRLEQSRHTVSPGPTIGIVQEDIPITLTGRADTARKILEYHLHRSLDFIGQKCDVLLWPETMLPTGMNRRLLTADVSRLLDDEIVSISRYVYGYDAPQKYTASELRNGLTVDIGKLPLEKYKPAAARFLLHEFLKPAGLADLENEKIRTIGRILFGQGSDDFKTPDLRSAVGMYMSDSAGRKLSEIAIRNVGALILGKNPQAGETPIKIGIIQRDIRARIARQLIEDAEHLSTLRGQGCMVSLASMLTGCPILAGGTAVRPNPRQPRNTSDQWVMQNSVLWFDAAGPGEVEYAKVHLVPFSEYVPFKYSLPALHDILRWFVPQVMPQLAPGENFSRFELTKGQETWQIVAPVCFEGTVSRLCRRMVAGGPKDRLVMANLSNDGWFVYRFGEGPYKGTSEQQQHLVHYVFRAVENRIPVVRSVNTGISGAINSNGYIESVLELQMEEYRKRTMIAGTLKVSTFVDSRVSLYSQIGDVFAMSVSILALILTGTLLLRKRQQEKLQR